MFRNANINLAKSSRTIVSLVPKPPRPIGTIRRRYSDNVRGRKHLKDLNAAQLKAVTFPPNTSLQILAGPGTGKTRVLTSRVVELIQEHKLPPSSIHALTFTRKAAREMRDRVERDLSSTDTNQIWVGTFHGVCVRYLKEYGSYLHIPPNFAIWDDEECDLLIWYIIQRYEPRITREVASTISQTLAMAKASLSDSPEDVFFEMSSPYDYKWIRKVFRDYQRTLEASNALDFADLERRCFELFNKVPWIKKLSNLRHVLVDEFQDTSARQYELIRKFFHASKGCITVVGDPDQSIYDWRNADSTNLRKMKKDLPDTYEILLEENYRSTESTLAACHAIIKQDPKRPEKSLYTLRAPDGPKPVLKSFLDTTQEAEFVANEIKRLIKKSDGLFGYGDIAILLRSNDLSWEMKDVFKAYGIPYRQLPEPSTWDVPEVKILLAYLYLATSTAYTPMLCRALAGPHEVKKEVIAQLVARGADENRPVFDVLERVCRGDLPDTDPSVKEKGQKLVFLVDFLRSLEIKGMHPAELLRYVRAMVNYDEFLEKRSPDWAFLHKRKVDSFIAFAKQYSGNDKVSPVRGFLELVASMSSKINNADVGKVSLLTCHSAKGLEWPVVFIPEVVDGVHPHHKTTDLDEARRLLYVACTRAQCLLYLTVPATKKTGKRNDRERLTIYPSEFVEKLDPSLFSQECPKLSKQDLQLFRDILGGRHRTRILEHVD
ncbi:hypothetical protein FS749_000124 [Ceratobasidium sp. UAMH 11750]|nr:hypothetical protein FS749_000124 [Ceratobasidium sp. UAMH 11750]